MALLKVGVWPALFCLFVGCHSSTPPPVPPSPPLAYTVSNYGEQAEIDLCEGGLTEHASVSEWLGRPYYAVHESCGGKPILKLQIGDKVLIEEKGYEVTKTQNVMRGDNASILEIIDETDAFLQTCYPVSKKMRVVGLELEDKPL